MTVVGQLRTSKGRYAQIKSPTMWDPEFPSSSMPIEQYCPSVTSADGTPLSASRVMVAKEEQRKGGPSKPFESKALKYLGSRSDRTLPKELTLELFALFAADMDMVRGAAMGGQLDAPFAPGPTLGLDTGAEVTDAHPKKGYGAKRTKPYAV
jgi:hypothetical protein